MQEPFLTITIRVPVFTKPEQVQNLVTITKANKFDLSYHTETLTVMSSVFTKPEQVQNLVTITKANKFDLSYHTGAC